MTRVAERVVPDSCKRNLGNGFDSISYIAAPRRIDPSRQDDCYFLRPFSTNIFRYSLTGL